MSVVCPVCGTEHPDGTVRCDGDLPAGGRCGKDLTGVPSTGGRSALGGER